MSAIPVHHTSLEDSPWDGPATVADMPNDTATLQYTHAWKNPDRDPKAKGSYKFPHHVTKGGPANLPAVRNGLARLSQARIPEGDVSGVAQHLRAHLEDSEENLSEVSMRARVKTARPYAKLRQGRADWYEIKNELDSDIAQIFIYDEIGYFGITAKDFVADLRDVRSDRIEVHLNTPGGEVFDGIAIYNALKQHPADIEVVIDSLAASIGSIIAMAGDRILIAKNAKMMIHEGHAMCIGNASDMTKLASLLDKTSGNLASIYSDRTGKSTEHWRNLMREETWFIGSEAVSAGLADEVLTNPTRIDSSWDLSIYNNSVQDTEVIESDPGSRDSEGFDPEEFSRALKEAFNE